MTDMTRPPGDHTPAPPDARGESALGTGPGTTVPDARQGTDADRATAPGTGTSGTAAPRGDEYGTGTPGRAAAHGDTLGTGTPGTGTPGTDATRGEAHGTGRTDAGHTGAGHTGAGHTGTGHTGGSGTPAHGSGSGTHDRLFPHDDSDKYGARLQHAVAGFVDGPRAAVEEADHVLEEIAARFTEAVTERRRTLRRSWQSVEGGEGRSVSSADTEQLRLALKDYRELAERLLHV
ncbi:hypothetical protein SUDANB108_02171 [Streptomyces sp. enrichment culture]|uniref:hypothetical protein n=1 Tax=Streptomyces sp. enrichment culture TaxID=1795815 RepID=UPI003F55ABF8